MKRLFIFILGMMLSAGAGAVVSSYAFSADIPSQDELLDTLFEQAGMDQNNKSDFKELKNLSKEKVPFENLYLFMLQNIANGPREASLKELASRTGYDSDELEDIVINGQTDTIVQHLESKLYEAQSDEIVEAIRLEQTQSDTNFESFLSSNDFSTTTENYLRWVYDQEIRPEDLSKGQLVSDLTREGVLEEYTYLKSLYDRELSLQRENRKLGYQSLASEIFMNNDLSDSANIDLLYDLDLIHYLMFGQMITYPDRSAGPQLMLASDESAGDDPIDEIILASDSSDSVDPYTCLGDDALSAALEAFKEEQALTEETGADADTEKKAPYFNVIFPDESRNGSDSGGGAGAATSEDSGVFDKLKDFTGFLESIEGQTGDWTRSLPCGEIFCIKLEVISETYGLENRKLGTLEDFEKTDNCIACHTMFLQKAMEDTTSQSLVPGKVSMNWFEDATCKAAGNLINLDLNVYLVKKPIDLDPFDDIEDKPEKEVENLKTNLINYTGFPWPGGNKSLTDKTLSKLGCDSILNLTNLSGSSRTQDDLRQECTVVAKEENLKAQEFLNEFKFSTDGMDNSTFAAASAAELYTLLTYFQNFQAALQDTYLTGNAPLPSLIAKKYCE